MTSLSTDNGGLRRIQFRAADGKQCVTMAAMLSCDLGDN